MIISHKHRFIFFAVPKTGSQSIRAALRPWLAEADWEQADWDVDRRLPIPEIAGIGHGHIQVSEIRPHLDAAVWDTYFKFSFVRNPWDRYVSCAFYRNAKRPLFLANPRGYLKLLPGSPRTMQSLFFRSQHCFLDSEEGRCALDFVGRFETLQADFERACRRIGIPATTLPRLNPSPHGPFASYYDDELIGRVEQLYERDIRCYGYRFEQSADDCLPR